MWGKDEFSAGEAGQPVMTEEKQAPPPTSSLHGADRLVAVTADGKCLTIAESLVNVLKREVASTNRVVLETTLQQVGPQEHHRDVLEAQLAKYPNMSASSIFVVSFVKEGCPEEYKLVKQWAAQFKPPLGCHVVTCSSAMKDPSLLIRNVGKSVLATIC